MVDNSPDTIFRSEDSNTYYCWNNMINFTPHSLISLIKDRVQTKAYFLLSSVLTLTHFSELLTTSWLHLFLWKKKSPSLWKKTHFSDLCFIFKVCKNYLLLQYQQNESVHHTFFCLLSWIFFLIINGFQHVYLRMGTYRHTVEIIRHAENFKTLRRKA